jgi:alkylation response protein AidB-like acyl-CoA dehydrogenase
MATFNYFAANAYLGALDALQACIPARVASEPAVARVLTEQAVKINAILVQLASLAHDADRLEHAVPSILGLRYILEETLEDAAQFALRSCGGVEVVRSALPLRLFAAIQLFKFHPVSKFQFITAAMQAPQ